jgi:membrane protease YdiL (CAAX protease family)
VAVLLAAIAFGAGHLPAAANVWPLDAVVVARTLLLNGIAGLVFGWFYVRHGLESAMLSHFAADLVLHVFAPLAAG